MPDTDPHHRAARRSLEIIEAVATDGGGLTLSELARRVQLPKSTAHTLIQTLAADGFLERETQGGHYVLGPRMLRMLGRLPDQFELPRVARPIMEALVDQVGETAILGVRSGASIIYVEQVEPPQYIRYAASLGEARPLYSSSIGKLFIAAMPPAALNDLLDESPPRPFTEATKTLADEIVAEGREIAAQGYALNRGETIDGVVAIAAPIYRGDDPQATLLAGLSVAGPTDRLSRRLEELCPLVIQTAKQIGLTLKPR
ncbi:MAG TPA: IclR family transcriptional regulator [Solirubrobacteraceae bacterium]|nr:IclR family transcriptional regulator [Solirubrobacteraceae bacterium]